MNEQKLNELKQEFEAVRAEREARFGKKAVENFTWENHIMGLTVALKRIGERMMSRKSLDKIYRERSKGIDYSIYTRTSDGRLIPRRRKSKAHKARCIDAEIIEDAIILLRTLI